MIDSNEAAKRLMVQIKFVLSTLPKIEKRAAEYLIEHVSEIGDMTLADFSRKSGSSQASVIRMCRRLNLDGYYELKTILQNCDDPNDFENFDNPQGIKAGDSMGEILRKVFYGNIQTLTDSLALATEDGYEEALQALLHARSVFFCAIGDAVVPCMLAQNKFMKIGIPCTVNSDPDLQVIQASNLSERDVAIAISHTGRSRPVVEAMRIAQKNGAITIGITKMQKSPLVRYCRIKLFTATIDLSEGKELVAQRIAEQAILEALYLGVLHKGEPQYRQRLKKATEALGVNKIL